MAAGCYDHNSRAAVIMTIFTDKCALIYGGGKGIGAAIAQAFALRGARIAVADIDWAAALATVTAIEASGGVAIALECDVTLADSVSAAAVQAESTFGEIDIVVNNVGSLVAGHPEDIPLSEWQRIMDLNLFSIVRSNDYFLAKMQARGSGHIINTASFAGLYPYAAARMPYVASKAAVVALTESMALYLLPQGIKVSCFCPGPVMTGVMDGVKTWTENLTRTGPGAEFALITAAQAAEVLVQGVIDDRIMIPTHASVLPVMQQHAVDPDQFIRDKIAAFARGETGLPVFK